MGVVVGGEKSSLVSSDNEVGEAGGSYPPSGIIGCISICKSTGGCPNAMPEE